MLAFIDDGWSNLINLFGQGYIVDGYLWGDIWRNIGELDEEQFDFGRATASNNTCESMISVRAEGNLGGSYTETGAWFYRPQ